MNSRPLIIDSFAGGGGASTGIEMALGRSPDIAINHNEAALALHAANHPETLHLSENIFKVDPLDHVAGKHVGLAWFSPDCKHFSKAKGGKPVERNIRDLAWIIVLWAERAKPDVIIMENVEEWKDWGPLLDTDKGLMPCPDRRGETFQKWCKAMRRAGYKLQHRELRACDYGAPTIRKRLFVVARRDGKPIIWPALTHGAPDSPEVKAGKRLPWRTAAEIIDWALPCPSIFDTSAEIMSKHSLRAVRPLADATMARVARGMKRYVLDAERPFIVNLTHGARLEDLEQPFNTITGANRGEKAVVSPSLISVAHGDSGGRREYPLEEPFGVVTAGGISHAVIAPSVIRFNSGATGQDAREPLSTITANSFIKRPGGAAPLGIIAPVLTAAQHGGSNRDVRDPHHTITASSKDQNSVIVPVLVQTGYGERDGQEPRSLDPHAPLGTIVAGGIKHAAVIPNLMSMKGKDRRDSSIQAPHPTVLAGGGHSALVSAFIAQHNNDSRREGGVNPGRSAEEPVSTVTQTGSQQGVVSAFVSRQFGASVGHAIDEPSATVTASVNKSALVAPFMQAYYGTGDGGEENQPCRTITTKDRHGHVEAAISAPPFTAEQHARARQVAEFMRSHGFWDDGEFVTVSIADELFVIIDIGMRMLTPRELYSAQGFPADYKIDQDANGNVFSKSVQVSCVGNSVSPPVAAALVAANCFDLVEYREAAE